MTSSLIFDIAGNVLLIAGALIFSVAVIGLFRFTDVYQRISAVGTAAGLGISLLIIGVFFEMPTWPNFFKLLIILFLQLATSSIGTMVIARSAYLTGSKLQPGYFDHLAEDQVADESSVQPDEDETRDTDANSSEAAQNSADQMRD